MRWRTGAILCISHKVTELDNILEYFRTLKKSFQKHLLKITRIKHWHVKWKRNVSLWRRKSSIR